MPRSTHSLTHSLICPHNALLSNLKLVPGFRACLLVYVVIDIFKGSGNDHTINELTTKRLVGVLNNFKSVHKFTTVKYRVYTSVLVLGPK